MTQTVSTLQTPHATFGASIQGQINSEVDALIASLPNPEHLTADQQRGIITRYTAVLEGNFIYWMTGVYLAAKSEEARAIVLENLHEEVRDCHPGMLRRFAQAAHAIPTDSDSLAVQRDLMNVRLFVGRLSGVPVIIMMAFFEGFIQKFMAYLADLAAAQGSTEMEYTDVHGICDVGHTQELFRALAAEMKLDPAAPSTNLFEGVDLLRSLLQTIIHGSAQSAFSFAHPAAGRMTA
jgi:heme oxygenase-like protein